MTNRDQPDDLDRRRRDLERALAARKPVGEEQDGPRTTGLGAFGQALRLSSEFIAGVLVGAAIGWAIDWLAGTSPWCLIVFLLLGFAAGILNVLRATGQVPDFGPTLRKSGDKDAGGRNG